ncbi:DUF1653 domain-containing protein [Ammoniphilus sp. 3BR4]|uniref:DUF1653 domain-containing protein n=1 Tax=Ammoniphilus sp. 3BR4 TaxID=3158265 RepID=UPI00346513A2
MLEPGEKPEAGDVYQSYKGNLYIIIGRAIHAETTEEMVIYKSDGEMMFVRPLEMFQSLVHVDGQDMPRYKKIWDKEGHSTVLAR